MSPATVISLALTYPKTRAICLDHYAQAEVRSSPQKAPPVVPDKVAEKTPERRQGGDGGQLGVF